MIGVIVVAAAAAVDAFTAGIFVGHKMGSNSVQTAAINILSKAKALPVVKDIAPVVAKVETDFGAAETASKAVIAKVELDVESLKAKLEALTTAAKASI